MAISFDDGPTVRATRPTGPKGKALMRTPLPPANWRATDRNAVRQLGTFELKDGQFVPSIPPTPAERPADLLSDTIPPTEPPDVVTTTPPRPHDVVRWHVNPPRCTVHQCASLESARAHVAQLDCAAFWKWAIRAPDPWPHVIDTGLVPDYIGPVAPLPPSA